MAELTLPDGDRALLTAALDDPGTDLQETLDVLVDNLAAAWPTDAGLTMTVVLDEVAVTLTAVVTSSAGGERPIGRNHFAQPVGVSGLAEFSSRNQAIGVLIGHGHTLAGARIEIHRRAARHAWTLDEAAQDILNNLPVPMRSTGLDPLRLNGVGVQRKRTPTLNPTMMHVRTDASKANSLRMRMRQPTSRARTGSTLGAGLTTPELAVLGLLVAGSNTAMIASALLLVPGTVRNHTKAIMAKLGAHSRVETIAISLSKNVLGTP